MMPPFVVLWGDRKTAFVGFHPTLIYVAPSGLVLREGDRGYRSYRGYRGYKGYRGYRGL